MASRVIGDRVDEPEGEPVEALRGVRPRVDRLGMDQVRARAEQSLFGSAAPAKLGRYVLLGPSGDGGMGVVYAAYDPELHRKVALKVLHPHRQQHDRAHERLIVEARALAKLDHPNVVKVHDVIMQPAPWWERWGTRPPSSFKACRRLRHRTSSASVSRCTGRSKGCRRSKAMT
jgi:serine/threonine protein kinase